MGMHSSDVNLYHAEKERSTYLQIGPFIEALATWTTGFWVGVFANMFSLQRHCWILFDLAFCHQMLIDFIIIIIVRVVV